MPVWLETAAQAGFQDLAVLHRSLMDEERIAPYPVYQQGGLDLLFELVGPEERWRLVETATIRAFKPSRGGQPEGASIGCAIE